MKTSKLFIILCLSVCFCAIVNAQSTYKGITIDRGNPDVDCIYVTNTNSYPCSISLEYKTGSKEASWRRFSVTENIPANVQRRKLGSVGSKIYGLKLTYVDILQPNVIEKFINVLNGGGNQNSSDQGKIQVADGLYLVSYGKTVVIEDDVNQRTTSITVAQKNIDYQTGKKIYEVACGGWTKQVLKSGIKGAIEYGIRAYGGTKKMADYAGDIAGIAYDAVCDHYGETYAED